MSVQADARTEYERDPVWGPMSHPARDAIASGLPPWKDHIYLGFWDANNDVYGFFHWNSSPNHETTKAQLSVWIRGEAVDLKSTLPVATHQWTSEYLDFDMGSHITITSERLTGTITVSPRFVPVDYGSGDLLPPLVPGEKLNHWQQGAHVVGEFVLGGERVPVDGLGYRTRTWGYRDDSSQFAEYVSIQTCLEKTDITAMKMLWMDGSERVDGFAVTADGVVAVETLRVVRGPAGETLRFALGLADGRELKLERQGAAAGMWCPIGLPEREGPTFCAYDEVIDWELDGERGLSLVEQAIIRRVF